MHLDPVFQTSDFTEAHSSILNFLLQYVGNGDRQNGKYKRLEQLMHNSLPLATNDLCQGIEQELAKALNAQNKIVQVEFSNPETEGRAETYRQNVLFDSGFVKNRVYPALLREPGSIIATDYPRAADGEPVPDKLIISPDKVIDVYCDEDGAVKWLMFYGKTDIELSEDEKAVFVFDGTSRRVFIEKNSELSEAPVIEAPHGLGYCPACFVSDSYRNAADNLVERIGPLSAVIEKLDWLLIWELFICYADSYASFPVVWMFANDEGPEDFESFSERFRSRFGGEIDPGVLVSEHQKALRLRANTLSPAPGEVFEISLPKADEKLPEVPLGYINPDVSVLKWLHEKQQSRKGEILKAVLGYGGEPVNNQAQNEKQITASFESRKERLRAVAAQVERVHGFLLDCGMFERFGQVYRGSNIFYGDKFYLLSEPELVQLYGLYKESGLINELENISDQLLRTRYRNNPKRLEAERLKNHLQPFYLSTNDEVTAWYAAELVSERDWQLKVRFHDLLQRWERENFAITAFDPEVGLQQKVDIILTDLNTYLDENERTTAGRAEGEA